MIYAQILNGVVVNTIVLIDPTLIPLFSQGYDSFVQIDKLPVVPGPGWSYDGTKFTAPAPVQPILATIPINQLSDCQPVLQNIVNSLTNQNSTYLSSYVPAGAQLPAVQTQVKVN